MNDYLCIGKTNTNYFKTITMKNLRLFFLMLLGLLCPSAFAQHSGSDYELDEMHPLITDVSQLSSPWSCSNFYSDAGATWEGDLSHLIDGDIETYWHSTWSNNTDRQYIQVDLTEPVHSLISLKFTRRWHRYNSTTESTTEHVTKWGIYSADEPDAPDADWMLLLEAETPYNRPAEILNTAGFDTQGKQYLRIYGEATNSGKRFWHCAEIQLYPCELASEIVAAINELKEVYLVYADYADVFEANAGTAAGQYPVETVAAFVAALNKANAVVDGGGSYTAAEVRALSQDIKTTYQAVLDSLIPFTLADGYYRIRHALHFINNDQEVRKYMYSQLANDQITARWYTPADLNTDCPSLWKVTNQDGFFDIVNCATNARFNAWESGSLTMSEGSTNLIAVELVENIDGDPCVTLRVASQIDNNRAFFHPLNHGISASTLIGSGTGDVLIGWANDQYKVSEWVFEPVDEATAQAIIEAYGPYAEHKELVENFIALRDEASTKLDKAKDLSAKIDESRPYITDIDQLSSPWNANHDFEGNIAHLIDNDPLTYWHTNWSDNAHWHYLQVELNEPVHELMAMRYVRRLYKYNSTDLCVNDHVTEWGIYGADEPDTEDEDWVLLAELSTPYTAPGEEIMAAFNPQGKQYLRFIAKNTNSGNRWWHAAEFQLYPGQIIDPATSQYHMMGSVGTTLNDVLTPLKDIDPETVTRSQYEALQAAYEAFNAVFVDPAPLRTKIVEVKSAAEIIVEGTDPGCWAPGNSVAQQLQQAISDAVAYDAAGQYTESTSQQLIDNLDAKLEGITAAANPILPGKWYRIRFGTEQEYADHNWPTGGNETQYRTVNGEATEAVINEANFGKYMTVAKLERVIDEDEGGEFTCNIITPKEKDQIAIDDQLYFDALEDITDPDMALFRFISVGDNEFYIQNKATGLYLQKKIDNNDGIYLSLHPSVFSQEVTGWGQNALFIKTLSGEQQNPLHFARNTNVVITYGGYGNSDGRRGCFYIETAGDVASSYAQNTTNLKVWDGAMIARCYPISLKTTDASQGTLYAVSAVERDEAEVSVTLKPMANGEAAAGRPFIYVKNGSYIPADERIEEDEPALVSITFGSTVVKEPQNSGALKGVFTRTNVDAGVLLVGEENFKGADSSTAIATDGAYISTDDSYSSSDEVFIVYDTTPEDGISDALQKVSKNGEIFTLDGRLVNRNGNINSLRGAQPGIYIVNGMKVVIK